MSDIDHSDEFDKAFEGFGQDDVHVEPPKGEETPPSPEEPPKTEGPKKEEEPAVEPPKREDGETTLPAKESKEEEKPTPPAEEPKPLTRDDITSIIRNLQTEERNSGKELETTTNEVLEAYYPDGLSNTLVDQKTGKQLKTPQDVIDATDGQMSMEDATQWLMNEQYKLDAEISRIKGDAQKIAETTVNFKRDSIAAIQKYEPLFKAYPHLQKKTFDLLMKQVEADEDKGVILRSPDVLDLYDTYLEPYQKAYEFSNNQPATNPNPPAPEPPKPSAEDRLDEGGDGGVSPVNDPNDFAQQVNNELSKGF